MKRLATALALTLTPCLARADVTAEPPPFEYAWFFRNLAGIGFVPEVGAPFFLTTAEFGRHPFGGALSTAVSASFGSDPFGERWLSAALGVQLKLDLTYVFLTGLWAENIDDFNCFPVRLQLGARLALAYSRAWALSPAYDLARPELQSFLDVEVPFGTRRWASVVVRGALDTPVALDTVFRWSLQAGFGFAWGLLP